MSEDQRSEQIRQAFGSAEEGEITDFSRDLATAPPPPVDTPTDTPHPLDTLLIRCDQIAERENSRPAYYGIEDLGNSLLMQGQLQACLVRPAAPGSEHGLPFELIFGYRRKRATETIGWAELRCDVRDINDREVVEMLITENYGREDLTPIAEANAMRRLISDYGLTQREVARRLGVDASQVSHRLKLLTLDEEILDKVDRGFISVSVAETISTIPDRGHQAKAVELAIRNDWGARKVERYARDLKEHGEPVEGDLELDPLQLVQLTDVRVDELPRLQVREDVSNEELGQIVLYALLRNGQDQEMLEYVEEKLGYGYEELWPYVFSLTPEQTTTLTRELALRFIGAAHRFPSLEPTLKAHFAARPKAREVDGDPFEEV